MGIVKKEITIKHSTMINWTITSMNHGAEVDNH